MLDFALRESGCGHRFCLLSLSQERWHRRVCQHSRKAHKLTNIVPVQSAKGKGLCACGAA